MEESPPLESWVSILASQGGLGRATDGIMPGSPVALDGVWGSARALVAAAWSERLDEPLVVVLSDADQADDFAETLPLFTHRRCTRFPALESMVVEEASHDELFGDRLRLLMSLGAGDAVTIATDGEAAETTETSVEKPDIVVATMASLLQPVPSPAQLEAMTCRLRVGDRTAIDTILECLVEAGMQRVTAVELPGEFAVRGGILDLFATDWFDPVRVEWFGDEIESMRRFGVATQRSTATLDSIAIHLIDAATDARHHLADHLPGSAAWLLIEPAELQAAASGYLERTESPDRHFDSKAVLATCHRFRVVTSERISVAPDAHRLPMASVERFSGHIEKVCEELDAVGGDDEVFVVCLTDAEVERVGEIMASTLLAKENRLHLLVGCLRSGFRLCAGRTSGAVPTGSVVLSGGEIFLRQDVRRPARRHLSRAIDRFTELRPGDLVVHLGHGIARFRGMEVLERENQVEEHLKLEFAGGTKIFVPASRIGFVQKYVGSSKGSPRLATIGGKRWATQKKAAERAVADMAVEMLELQAARKARPGIRFPPDSHWQFEFDTAFPYQETPDQLTAIAAIKQDMCEGRPMDRLLCGDVGYGKTELAIRAAFKAVDSGYQVAILVPTTILAEQHHRTFSSRMAEFPVEIAVLSRFRTRKQQTQTLADLADGKVDIVVGTHRIVSKDVRFHNLGLVVIDEEQRFGVQIKERLKHLRKTVDVLTMTATPIPRTLHLSLVGARDISNLETPPEDRVAVETRVLRFDPEQIRHAILRELNRNGQVFFVHNRIRDIHRVEARLREIVPEATIEVGHGQMAEGELEAVMVNFVNHKFDVLLATTIVESGLDIPNANTIFIDDANRYGLAELHQLRGRVGRYKHRAHCYLLLDEKKHISPMAAKRMRAIEEFSNMGAGFAIAMRDLEIRGAGNILGTQQSGHIAAVGYEFYCQLLEQTVRRLRREPPRESPDVDIDLPGQAHLPDAYIEDMRAKLDLYRRIARVTTDEELEAMRQELCDRFGPLPAPAERLLALSGLRIDAAIWAIRTVHWEEGYVVFGYTDAGRIRQLASEASGPLRIVDEQSAYLPIACQRSDVDVILETVKSLLQP